MKAIHTLIIGLFLLSFSAKGQSLEWFKEIHFDTITYPGVKQVFIQMCLPEVDSVIANGSATFRKADIAGIGPSRYKQTFKDTILTRVELETKGQAGYDRLYYYFDRITNNDSMNFIFDELPVRVATISRNGKQLQLTLVTNRSHKKNLLVIQSH